jgi:triosephosphate isomerase (TIM)
MERFSISRQKRVTARRTKWVIGNWKLHGSLQTNVARIAALREGFALPTIEAGVCVPFPYLSQVNGLLEGTGLGLGAQNISEFDQGAYTGEVSGLMLHDVGCTWVLVGHSERRALFGEDNDTVARKANAALRAGLTPIVCVGEDLSHRQSGIAEPVVAAQLEALRARLSSSGLAHIIWAYEPVWAIGTGHSATVTQVSAMHGFIRGWLEAQDAALSQRPILYGGSVKPDNAAALFAVPHVDGGLIGGASLEPKQFLAICEAANRVSI